MKKLILFTVAMVAQLSLAVVTVNMQTASPPTTAGKSFTKKTNYSYSNSSSWTAALTSTISSVNADSFKITLAYSGQCEYSASTFTFEIITFVGEGCGFASTPNAKVSKTLAKSNSKLTGAETIQITGLSADSLYWFQCRQTAKLDSYSGSEDTFWTCIKTSPENLTIDTVTITPTATSGMVNIPLSKLGTGNESATIDIVIADPNGASYTASETVTEPGTVSKAFAPLLAGTDYTAVVTVTGSKTGVVTKEVSFTTLASAPTLGDPAAGEVEDVSAVLRVPVEAIGEGNTYVDVAVTADGSDGSSVTGETQRIAADGGVAEVAPTGLTPYTEYTATAVATASSGGTATRTVSFTTRAGDPEIGAVFVMSQQDAAGAFLVPVSSMGAGNTDVTITAIATGDDGTRAESSTVCTALGNAYATITGLSPGTPYAVEIVVTGNHGGRATATATLTTTGTRTTIASIEIDGDTLPTRWLIDKGFIENSLGLTEEDLVALWGTEAANGRTLRECYVAGLDPGDPDADLVAHIAMDETAAPVVTWTPDLTPERVYSILGRTNLTDEAWVYPTNESTRFYRVKVALPQ